MLIHKHLQDAIDNVVPLVYSAEDQPYETRITNMQSTTKILLKDGETKLPLKDIVMSLGGMAQYRLDKFAAVIMRGYFGIGLTTCMVFEAGKLVVVGAKTVEHSRYAAQMYRRLLERVVSVYYDPETDQNIICDLQNRTQFLDFEVGNLAAASLLPFRINLKMFQDSHLKDADYNPESFPGCRYKIWLNPRSMCKCVKRKKEKDSCECNVQSTLFDTGAFIVTGSTSIQDTNRAKHIIIKETRDFLKFDKLLPKNKRYEARRQEIFNASVESTGLRPVRKKRKIEKRPLEDLLQVVQWSPVNENSYNALTQACLTKQIGLVRHIIAVKGSKYFEETISELDALPDNAFAQQISAILRAKNVVL